MVKKAPLMGITHLPNMRMKVGFDQGQLMNSINFKIVYSCFSKNVFKGLDDDLEDLVPTFGTLEDAML